MAKQVVEFRQGGPLTGDSGERGDGTPGIDSIKPIDDGERAVAANVDRPTENIRKRTEVLRDAAEDQLYLQDGDMRWVLSSGKADGLHDPGTEWPVIEEWKEHPSYAGYWYFQLKAGIAVVAQPLNTPKVSTQENKQWEFPLGLPTAWIDITTNRRAYSFANIREVVWQALPTGDIVGTHGVPGICDLQLSGEDNHILTITIEDTGATQIFHLNTAFLGYAASLNSAGFLCGVSGDSNEYVTIADIPDVDYVFSKTFDRELHYIQAATFDAFFASDPPNTLLEDGDTLAVMWEYLTEPSPGTDGRRQAIPSNANTEVLVGRLFITSDHPEWIPLSIPLCKRIKNELLWLDGTLVTDGNNTGMQLRFGENGYTVKRIFEMASSVPITMSSKWFNKPSPPTWSTILGALDGIVADIAGTQDYGVTPVSSLLGDALVGVSSKSTSHPSSYFYDVPAMGAGLNTVINSILTLVNAKGALDHDEIVTSVWQYNNRINHGENFYNVRNLHAANGARLIYRNRGKLSAGPIDFTTLSIYEGYDAVAGTARVAVFGGTLNSAGTTVSAPPSGGPGTVTLISWSNVGLGWAVKTGVAAGSSWSTSDPSAWDTYIAAAEDKYHIYSHTKFHRNTAFLSKVTHQALDEETSAVAEDNIELADGPTAEMGVTRYRHRYETPTSVVYRENRVMEGMNAIPHPDTPYSYNTSGISAGAAIVGGREVIFKVDVGIDSVVAQCSSGTLAYVAAATNNWKYACFWLYVWLRKDGTIWYDHLGPSHNQDLAPGVEPSVWNGNRVGGPRTGSGLIVGGWQRHDYCLIGLTWVAGGVDDGTQPYLGYVVPMGDNLWRFQITPYPWDPPATVVNHEFGFEFDASGVNFINLTKNNFLNNAIRSPGVPVGVTSRALMHVSTTFYSGNPAVLAGADYGIFLIPFPANNTLYRDTIQQYARQVNAPMLRDGVGLESTGYVFNDVISVEVGLWQQTGYENTRPRYGKTLLAFASTSPPPGNIQLMTGTAIRLLGFYWDRDPRSAPVQYFWSEA